MLSGCRWICGGLLDRFICIAFTKSGHYAQKLPGKFTIYEDFVHAGVTFWVFGEKLNHLITIGIDDSFQNLTACGWFLVPGEPLIG